MKIALFIEQGCVHNEVLLAQYEVSFGHEVAAQ
jgi:hypothetical protein